MELEENNVEKNSVEENKSIQKVETKKKFPKTLVAIIVLVILGVVVWKSEILKPKGVKFVELFTKEQSVVEIASKRTQSFNKNGEKKYTFAVKNNLLSIIDSSFSYFEGDLNFEANVLRKGKNVDASGEINLGDINLQSIEFVKENNQLALSVPNIYEGFLACNIKNLNDVSKKLGITSGESNENYSAEAKKIATKYGYLIAQNIGEHIEKETVETKVNSQNLKSKKYILSMDEKKLNILAQKVLETLKDDDKTIEFIVKCMNENENVIQTLNGEISKEELKEDIIDLYKDISKKIETIETEEDIFIINIYEYKGKNIKTELTYSGDDAIYKTSFEAIGEKEKDYAKFKIEIAEFALNFEFIGNKLDDNYTSEITIGADGTSVSIAEFRIQAIENTEKKIRKIQELNAIMLDSAKDDEIEEIKNEIKSNMGFVNESVSNVYEKGEFKVSNSNEILKVLDISAQKYNLAQIGMKKEEIIKVLGEPDIIYGTEPNEYLGWNLENTEEVYLVSVALNNDAVYAVYNDIASNMQNNIQISLELETQIDDLTLLYGQIKNGMKKADVEAILGDKCIEMYKDAEENIAYKWYDKNENILIIEFDVNNQVSYIDEVVRDA